MSDHSPTTEQAAILTAGPGPLRIDHSEVDAVAADADLEVDRTAERAHLFEHVWRQVERKFYTPDLHGADWDFYTPGSESSIDSSVSLGAVNGWCRDCHRCSLSSPSSRGTRSWIAFCRPRSTR